MVNELVFEGPINNLSLGNVSVNLLKALYKKGAKVHYLPIGPVDIGNYNLTNDFKLWLQSSGSGFLKNYRRDLPTIKNWHINQSWMYPTNRRFLLTYHECDAATQEEINIIKNLDRVFFCGNYSPNIFRDYGLTNVDTFNLGFDADSFHKIDKQFFDDGRIQWFLGAKAEKRKRTFEILALWAKKFGKKQGESYRIGEQRHFLNVCILNPFYDVNVQQQQVQQALNGVNYINIQFFWGFLDRLSYNQMLNASDIDLTGLSGGESWSLIPFTMSCLGKWAIVLNCSGMRTWANTANSILVNPNGKQSVVDNIFFHPNSGFNTGNFYTFNPDEVIAAMELAATKFAKTPNPEGEKLAQTFTYDNTVDEILKHL